MDIVRPEGHADVVRGLWRAAAAERLPHALCFSGPKGCGKFTAALWFAQGMLCRAGALDAADAQPCGTCPSCKKLASGDWRGNHPDLMRVDPVEYVDQDGQKLSILSIYWIRERSAGRDSADPPTTIEEFLALRPVESERRIVLVREADRLTQQAQNTLLKTLEEPAPGTTLVLETSHVEALLPTVRSRVVQVPFGRLEEAATRTLVDRLVADGSIAADADVEALVALCEGCPGAALQGAREGLVGLRALLLDALCGRRRPALVLQGLWQVEGEFRARTPRMREAERVRVATRLAGGLLADALRLFEGLAPARHRDVADQLVEAVVPRTSRPVLAAALETIGRVAADVDLQMAPDAAMERLVRTLADVPRARAVGAAAGPVRS